MKSVSIARTTLALSLLDNVAAILNTNKQSTVHCFTSFGKSSLAHLPTKSFTTTAPRTATVIISTTPTTTDYPPDVTSTITSTVVTDVTTTLAQNTDTITETDSAFTTTTITLDPVVITYISETTTTSTTTDTTTIAAPTNFVDSEDSLNGIEDLPLKRGLSGAGLNGRLFSRAQPTGQSGSQNPSENGLYPHKVLCKKIIFSTSSTTSIVTAPTSTFTAAPETDFTMVTTTITQTQTTQPSDASVTDTITNTMTDTAMVTPTTTSTYTDVQTALVNAPQQTQYAQCSQNNIVNYANGQDINFVYGPATYSYNYQITDPTSCCIVCAQDTTCMASMFDPTYGYCAIADGTASQCASGNQNTGLIAALDGVSGDGGHFQYVSNGACGALAPSSGGNLRVAPA